MSSYRWADRFGTLASSLCAVHCALVAALPALLSMLGLGFLLGQTTEWLFALGAIGFALAAIVFGWREHRSYAITVLLGLGICGVLGSRLVEVSVAHDHHHLEVHDHETNAHEHDASGEVTHLVGAAIGTFAGGLLVVGHLLNLRATRRRRHACCADEADCASTPVAAGLRHAGGARGSL